MFKTANVGSADRIIRIVVGALLVASALYLAPAYFATPLMKWGAVIIGLVLIATALVRFCPIYRIINASTNKAN